MSSLGRVFGPALAGFLYTFFNPETPFVACAVINGLALQEALEAVGIATRLMSSLGVTGLCEPFARHRCMGHLEKGRVVVLAGGSGRPFPPTPESQVRPMVALGQCPMGQPLRRGRKAG